MNWDAIGAIAELIGAIAVVLTLVYLAVQVRHSKESLDANTSAIRPETAARTIADIVLEDLLDPELSDPVEQRTSGLPLAAYAGLYELETGVLVEFGLAEDVPYAIVGGGSARPLHALGDHVFGTDEAGVIFRFMADEQGTISSVVLELTDAEVPGRRIPPLMLTTSELREYAGTYFSGELEIFYDIEAAPDSMLVMRQLRLADVRLKPIGADRFREEPGGNLWIEFRRGRRGRIEGFELSVSRARDIASRRE